MEILQVIPVFSYPFGGPVTVVSSLSKELAKRNDVFIFTTTALDSRHDSHPRVEETDGYRVLYFARSLSLLCNSQILGQLNLSVTMMKALKAHLGKFDIIHVHSWQQFPEIVVHHYATKYKSPYIIQPHGSIPITEKKMRKVIHSLMFGNRILNDASKVIAVTEAEALQCEMLGVARDRIAIIPNGLDLELYKGLPQPGFFKAKYGISENKRVILYMGRIHEIKGLDTLVKAFCTLVRDAKYSDLMLAIVGPDDGYLHDLLSIINALRLQERVIVPGALCGRTKLAAYVDSEVCVLPSKYELWGMTVLEAYACARPVIASNVGGPKELVIDGTTGLLFEPGNVSELGRALSYMLNNKSTRTRMGLRCRRFVNDNFAIEKVARRLEDLYREHVLMKSSRSL